jgi:hypothetical protein
LRPRVNRRIIRRGKRATSSSSFEEDRTVSIDLAVPPDRAGQRLTS